MGAICTACERDGEGSCCGAGFEDRYDGRLLLVNRLLGVQLPKSRLLQARCYFFTRIRLRFTSTSRHLRQFSLRGPGREDQQRPTGGTQGGGRH